MSIVRIKSLGITDGTIVNADINASAAIDASKLSGLGFTSGTAVATTSGTAFDFTGIPATAKLIIISFSGVSLTAGDNLYVQLGDSGGIETSGYESTSVYAGLSQSYTNATDAFTMVVGDATGTVSGHMILTLLESSTNSWVNSHTTRQTDTRAFFGGGKKSLSATLTQVRITRGGSNTFDAGKLNVLYI